MEHEIFPLKPSQSYGKPQPVRLLASQERFPTPVYRQDADIFCPLATATAFGGDFDDLDDGRTASGVMTRGNPLLVGCSLPMPMARGCRGTPFPDLPWKTPVFVTWGKNTVEMPLIDVGPSGGLHSRAIIDITVGGWAKLLGRPVGQHEANSLEMVVSFRIKGIVGKLMGYEPWSADVGSPYR